MLGLGHGVNTDITGTGEVFHNNYSMLLDGSNDYIDVDTLASDIDVNKCTFSVWIKFNGTGSNNDMFIKASVDSSNQIYMAYITSTEKFRFTYKAGGTAKNVEVDTTEEGDGNWTHLAMTWNVDADELKGYVNGSQVASTLGSLGTFSGTIDKCYVGRNTLAADSYFKGYIDEVSVFSEVVSIADLYNEGRPTDVEFSGLVGLEGYWRFAEGTGTSERDESGKSNTATLVNGAAWSIVIPSD